MTSEDSESEGCGQKCRKILHLPERFMSMVFYKYGKLVANHAFKFLIVSFIILLGLSLGLIRIETDFKTTDTVTAFIARETWLDDSLKQLQKEWPVNMSDYYGNHEYYVPEMYLLYVHTPGSSGNVFTTTGKQEILQFCQAIETATASYKGKTLTFEDVCARAEGVCVKPILCDTAYLQVGMGMTDWYPLEQTVKLIQVTNEQTASLPLPWPPSLGDVVTSAGDTNLIWYFQKNDQGYEWQYKVFNQLKDLTNTFTNAEYYLFSYGRARYEDRQTFINDMPYLSVGFALLFVYCCVVTFNLKLKGNRLMLTLSGLLSTLLCMSASFGIMIAGGVPFVTISLIIPFVVIGIGIDAILVMSTEWANCEETSDPVERIGTTMERAFMGISLSHLTSLIAFLVGLISPFPAVDYLCGYMAVSIAIMWFGEGTLFLSFLSLHGRWTASGDDASAENKTNVDKNGVQDQEACFAKVPQVASPEEPNILATNFNKEVIENFSSPAAQHNGVGKLELEEPRPVEFNQENKDRSVVEACLMWILPRTVTNKYFKVIIMMGLGIGAGLAIVSVYHMPREELYSIYYKDGSSIGEFYDARKKHYPFSYLIPVIMDKELQYSNLETFQTIKQFYADMEASGMYEEFPASWYSLFVKYETDQGVNSFDGDEEAFVNRLQAWMDTEIVYSNVANRYYLWLKQDVVIQNNKIIRSRFYIDLTGSTEENLSNAKKGLNSMKNVYDKYKDILAPYSFSFVLAEMDRNVKLLGEVWTSIGIVAAVAVFVTLLFVPDVIVYLLVLFCFFCAMICAMGLMNAWGLTYALSTYVEIMLGFGLCVDYMAHIARGYMVAKGDSESEKVKQVMGIVGVAMTNAVVTSILGVVMLCVAESYANRSFFKAMFLIFLCSYLFGVLLLPVLLTIVGGSCFGQDTEREKAEKEKGYSGRRGSSVAPGEVLSEKF